MEWLDQLITVAVILFFLALYLHKNHSYWKEHGIPQPATKFLLGHFTFDTSANKISQHEQMDKYYKAFKTEGDFVGLYFFTSPAVLLTNLDLIKTVFVKDFDYFVDHGNYYNERDDPISATLFNVNEESWRKLRTSLSPTFTGAKMRMMFPTVVQIAERHLIKTMDQLVVDSPSGFEVKDLMSRFTTDVIGDCAFGLQCNSFEDPNNDFRRIGSLSFKRTWFRTLKINFITIFPKLARFLRIKRIRPEVSAFYTDIVRKTVDYREKNGIVRNDFLNLLIGLKNEEKLTMLQVIAQSFVFFTAGFETSSTTLTFCLHELAVNEEVQEKLRGEIERVLGKYNGELSYEAVQEMTYLDMVLNETLRKYPVLHLLQRLVTKDYLVDETEIVLRRGTMVLIPARSIHHDPEIHQNPDRFDPERFNGERVMHPCSFLGFGYGSRNCIASRFGMMQMKIGLVKMMTRYKLERAIDTEVPIKMDSRRVGSSPVGGVPLKVTRL